MAAKAGEPETGEAPAPRARATIDLQALAHNLAEVQRAAAGREPIAVVKADAYGHGAPSIARALEAAGVRRLAVVSLGEAAELRGAGVRAAILLLGGLERPGDADTAVELDVAPVLQHAEQLAPLAAAAARRGRTLGVQLEVDTGMSRMGVAAEAAAELAARVAAEPSLRLEGVYTHLARADEEDLAPTRAQLERFGRALAALAARGVRPALVHVANSAGVLAGSALASSLPPEVNAVRPGLALYGASPSPHLAASLRPVMTVRARIVNLRRVAAGDAVGYGGTWRSARATRVATVALGYADGLPWSLANRGEMALRGRRVPIVGRISMDLATLDVGDEPAELGDEVIVFGEGGPRVEDVAAWAGTIPWEILVRVGRRVERTTVPGGV